MYFRLNAIIDAESGEGQVHNEAPFAELMSLKDQTKPVDAAMSGPTEPSTLPAANSDLRRALRTSRRTSADCMFADTA